MNQDKAKNFKRATAVKVHINHLISGNYVKDDVNSYIETEFGIHVSRVRILGTIVTKWMPNIKNESTPDRTPQATLIIDDGTETIRIKAWKDDIKLIENFEIGDIVDIIGRIREYDNQIYITPEIIKKIEDPNWELVRELEIIEFLGRIKANSKSPKSNTEAQPLSVNITETIINNKNGKSKFKDKIVELIRELDEGLGVSIAQLKERVTIPENDFQNAIMELINEGTIYQPNSGKYKLL